MRPTAALTLLALACASAASSVRPRTYDTHDYYALHLQPTTSPRQIAGLLGLDYRGQLGELEDHHIFSSLKHDGDVVDDAVQTLRRRRRKREADSGLEALDGVLFSQKQKLKPRLEKRGIIPERAESATTVAEDPPQSVDAAIARQQEIARALEIEDPIFKDQWHLYNPVQIGHDVNVTDVWKQGITGHNSTVAIVDDGLDMYSDDLKDNFFAAGSYDFNDQTEEPKPRLSDDRHGTRCAGEIAAVKNKVCGVGVAWDAKVAGIRILSKQISDADEAEAMNYAYQENQIYSCSWGPPDDGQSMDAPGILIKRAMLNAVQKGRGGKGSVYVFASGNGAAYEDNCNFDGYTNSIYSITVGAIDRKGLHPFYSERCSAQLVVTYSSGSGDAIHTTDVGTNRCYSQHGGTSAAAPLAAGIFSLVLSVRPDLNWRDLQYLVVDTAVPVNEEDGSWQETAIGKKFSHRFGYGKLDAYGIVEAAKTFKSVKPQAWYISPWMHVKHPIPQGDQGLASTFQITENDLKAANLESLEHVTVTMNVEHGRRGDLSVDLQSPSGVVSHLSATRKNDASKEGYKDWTFMSVVHWGESGIGLWTVVVKDTQVNEYNGTFVDWKITLWGQSIDGSKQDLLPMPTDHDDDDHDVTTPSTTISGAVSTTSLSTPAAASTDIEARPSDHPDRPVNQKPSSSTTPSPSLPTSTSTPSPSPTSTKSTFLPSFFPTFGVSHRTQIWIYASLGLIVLFIVSLSVYVVLVRRRRRRRLGLDGSTSSAALNRDDYEFEMLDDQDAMGLSETRGRGRGGVTSGGGGGGDGGAGAGVRRSGGMPGATSAGKKRAGELYDAFAGESDEDVFSDLDDSVDDDNEEELRRTPDSDSDDDEDGLRGYRDDRSEAGEGGDVADSRDGRGRGRGRGPDGKEEEEELLG
ncbi:MAG: hypothetical protein M1819_002543 [Sarea resinae]|nr:MAG: hypothetical protein M1819_002543 [Sarea resinae]